MERTVKAAVLEEPGKMNIREFPYPKLGKGAAIGRMVMAGICGTDKHSYKGESVQYKGTKNEIDIPYPIIQGHENVFVIEEIDELGSRTLDFDGNILKPGDRVTMCPDVVCGTCWYCKISPHIHGVNICCSATEICVPVTTDSICTGMLRIHLYRTGYPVIQSAGRTAG